jgi:hypothetical protein
MHAEDRLSIVELQVEGPRIADALHAVETVCCWEYIDVPPPSRSAAIRLKKLLLAIAPFTPIGPQEIRIGPSKRGGLYVRLFDERHREIAVVVHNDDNEVMCIYGKEWRTKPKFNHRHISVDEAVFDLMERFNAASL